MLHRIIIIPYVENYHSHPASINMGFIFRRKDDKTELSFPQISIDISESLDWKEKEDTLYQKAKELSATLTTDLQNCLLRGLKFGFLTNEEICDFYVLTIHGSQIQSKGNYDEIEMSPEYQKDTKLYFDSYYENIIEKQFCYDAINQLGFLLFYVYVAQPFIEELAKRI